MDVGVVVQNIGTVAAIADAAERGIPLIERVTTVTGGAINEPKNLRLRVGTLFSHAINPRPRHPLSWAAGPSYDG